MLQSGPVYCILTSAFWAISSLFATRSIRSIGAPLYNCLRLICGGVVIGLIAVLTGPLVMPALRDSLYLLGSSIIGLTLGDLLLFHGFSILGARRSTLIFMLNIPITAALGIALFQEELTTRQLLGSVIGLVGICIATLVNSPRSVAANPSSERHQVDEIRGKLWHGISFCLLAAFCQSCGLLLLKPVLMEQRYSIPQVAMMRFALAAFFASALYLNAIPLSARGVQGTGRFAFVEQELAKMSRSTVANTAAAIVLGGVIGFILYVTGISKTPASLAALFTSLSPLFVLPFLFLYTGKLPPPAAWAGAAIGLTGVYLCLVP
jgi:drug/metabolite transporter (DMT)-like permease